MRYKYITHMASFFLHTDNNTTSPLATHHPLARSITSLLGKNLPHATVESTSRPNTYRPPSTAVSLLKDESQPSNSLGHMLWYFLPKDFSQKALT